MTRVKNTMPKASHELKLLTDGKTAHVRVYYYAQDGRYQKLTGIYVPVTRKKTKGEYVISQLDDFTPEQQKTLDTLKTNIQNAAATLNANNIPVTKERLSAAMDALAGETANSEEKQTVVSYIQKRIAKLESRNKLPKGAKQIYEAAILQLRAYEAWNKTTLTFAQMDRIFFEAFDEFIEDKLTLPEDFRVAHFAHPNKPVQTNTRFIYLNTLRRVLNHAGKKDGIESGTFRTEKERMTKHYSTFEFEAGMKQTKNIKYHLTEDEIERIYALRNSPEVLNSPHRERLLLEIDRTVLNCYLGQRYGDANSGWSEKDLTVVDGVTCIRIYESEKTKKDTLIPILGLAEKVLSSRDWKPLPALAQQTANKWIKKICCLAGITQPVKVEKGSAVEVEKWKLITTHSCRRSLVTNLSERGVPDHVIIVMSGHSNVASIQPYLSKDQKHAVRILKQVFATGSHLKKVS